MDIFLLGITVLSLIVALVMSVTAWRVMRDDKQRSAARIAALSAASADDEEPMELPIVAPKIEKAPWSPAPFNSIEYADTADSISLRTPHEKRDTTVVSHAPGFLGAVSEERTSGGGQRSLAIAAVALFVVLSGGLVWMMAGPEGTTSVAVDRKSVV